MGACNVNIVETLRAAPSVSNMTVCEFSIRFSMTFQKWKTIDKRCVVLVFSKSGQLKFSNYCLAKISSQ